MAKPKSSKPALISSQDFNTVLRNFHAGTSHGFFSTPRNGATLLSPNAHVPNFGLGKLEFASFFFFLFLLCFSPFLHLTRTKQWHYQTSRTVSKPDLSVKKVMTVESQLYPLPFPFPLPLPLAILPNLCSPPTRVQLA